MRAPTELAGTMPPNGLGTEKGEQCVIAVAIQRDALAHGKQAIKIARSVRCRLEEPVAIVCGADE